MVESKLTIFMLNANQIYRFLIDSAPIFFQKHHKEFPILALLTKDYLACSATLARVERCFSAAAKICRQDQGSLLPRTIKQSVSVHHWLQQGVKADGDFENAQAIATQNLAELQDRRTETATVDG